jgi:hypothetical protein
MAETGGIKTVSVPCRSNICNPGAFAFALMAKWILLSLSSSIRVPEHRNQRKKTAELVANGRIGPGSDRGLVDMVQG